MGRLKLMISFQDHSVGNHLNPHIDFPAQIATHPFFNCVHFYLHGPTGQLAAAVVVVIRLP